MHKYIFILSFIITNLLAYESIDITQNSIDLNAQHKTYCVKENYPLSATEVLNDTSMKRLEKSNIGFSDKAFWCRINLVNKTNKVKTIILTNTKSGVDSITAYIYCTSGLQKYEVGDMHPMENRSLPSLFSNITVELEPYENVAVVYKAKSVGNLELAWRVQSIDKFVYTESVNTMIIAIFFGFFIALAMYNIFTFYYMREKIYLLYTGLVISVIISQASLQGSLFYVLNGHVELFLITQSNWVFTHLFLAFMWLFSFYFFEVSEKSKFYYIFLSVITYNILVVVMYIYAYIDHSILQYATIVGYIAIVESLLLLGFAISMYRDKKPGATYFLFAHIFYTVAIFIYIMTLIGSVELTIFTKYSSAFGVLGIVSFISLALSSKIKVLKEEHDIIKKEIERNKQFTLIGTTITYITHQWKQPLTVISSQVANILAKIEHNPKDELKTIKNKVLSIEENIMDVNDTLTDIKKLFSSKQGVDSEFKVITAIQKTHKILEQKIETKLAVFTYDSKCEYSLNGNVELLTHVLVNIIDNALDAFETNSVKNSITLNVTLEAGILTLTINDNAGGIKITPIERVFDPNVTSKTFGMGIGLAMVKNIIESKFNGSVEAKNNKIGSKFIVKIQS
ncbi:MAG: GHKL domain-containing protein [Helicobacteraceae bacterium]|nr:GHKL domain-containing protein [Helicobacteraceae bacterium]